MTIDSIALVRTVCHRSKYLETRFASKTKTMSEEPIDEESEEIHE